MSREERITVRIRRDGTVEAVTQGIKGDRCLAYIDVLEGLAAARAVDSHFTPEYYEPATVEEATEAVRLEEPG